MQKCHLVQKCPLVQKSRRAKVSPLAKVSPCTKVIPALDTILKIKKVKRYTLTHIIIFLFTDFDLYMYINDLYEAITNAK